MNGAVRIEGGKALILVHSVFSEGKMSVLEKCPDLASDWGGGH